jgi:hypothetical protein
VTWTEATADAPWSARFSHSSVVFNNRIWVIGGYADGGSRNDVWSSADGVTWTQATGRAPWAGRGGHTSVVFDNRLWVIGGNRSIWFFNDVWFSADGGTWTQATGPAPWSARIGHTSVVFDNRAWVIGGNDGIHRNDVWSFGAPSVPTASVSGYRYVIDSSPDTIPSAAASFSASRDISVPCNAPGEHWFHVAAMDTLGNLSPAAHYRFNVLDASPTVTSQTQPTEREAPGDEGVTLEWTTPVPNVVRYYYAFDNQSDTEPMTEIETTSLSFDSLAPGVYWFHVRSEDECGFLSPVTHRRVGVGVNLPGPDIAGPVPANTNTGPVTWTLTYAGVQDILLLPEDVSIVATGDASGSVILSGTDETRTISLSNITGDGTLAISVPPGTASDLAGNLAGGATGDPVTVDNTPPAIAIGAPSAASSSGERVTYTVNYTDADDITLRAEDITLNTTGDAAGVAWVTGSGASSRTVSIVYPSGYGTIGFSIAAGTARDAAGNLAPAAGPSETFSVAHHTLRMRVHGWGTTTPTAGAYAYSAPEEVALNATPLEGAEFLGWDIDGVIHLETPHTLTMDRDYLVTANFSVPVHTGDQDGSGRIGLSELLRVIQFFNTEGFGCQEGTEDGYAPNAPDRECTPHSSDYMPHNWQIELQELLRLIQFFNTGGYRYCPEAGTEDGYCPGPPTGS